MVGVTQTSARPQAIENSSEGMRPALAECFSRSSSRPEVLPGDSNVNQHTDYGLLTFPSPATSSYLGEISDFSSLMRLSDERRDRRTMGLG